MFIGSGKWRFSEMDARCFRLFIGMFLCFSSSFTGGLGLWRPAICYVCLCFIFFGFYFTWIRFIYDVMFFFRRLEWRLEVGSGGHVWRSLRLRDGWVAF